MIFFQHLKGSLRVQKRALDIANMYIGFGFVNLTWASLRLEKKVNGKVKREEQAM